MTGRYALGYRQNPRRDSRLGCPAPRVYRAVGLSLSVRLCLRGIARSLRV